MNLLTSKLQFWRENSSRFSCKQTQVYIIVVFFGLFNPSSYSELSLHLSFILVSISSFTCCRVCLTSIKTMKISFLRIHFLFTTTISSVQHLCVVREHLEIYTRKEEAMTLVYKKISFYIYKREEKKCCV